MSTEGTGGKEIKESESIESIESKDSSLEEEALGTRLTEELATLPAIITEAIVTTKTKEIKLDDFEISCRQKHILSLFLPSRRESRQRDSLQRK